ncbi:MAG: type II toxin-antitoxin system VapC family toxin [Opitutaceae bacterium]
MATPTPKRQLIAVDSNVLLDLADGNQQTHDAIELVRNRGTFQLVATPTVVQELAIGVEEWSGTKQELAETALRSMLGWGIVPFDLKAVGHGICECVADLLREKGYLPDEERNDSLIWAEASLAECVVLITWDDHFLGAPQEKVRMTLAEKDLRSVTIASPATLNSLFQPRSRRR